MLQRLNTTPLDSLGHVSAEKLLDFAQFCMAPGSKEGTCKLAKIYNLASALHKMDSELGIGQEAGSTGRRVPTDNDMQAMLRMYASTKALVAGQVEEAWKPFVEAMKQFLENNIKEKMSQLGQGLLSPTVELIKGHHTTLQKALADDTNLKEWTALLGTDADWSDLKTAAAETICRINQDAIECEVDALSAHIEQYKEQSDQYNIIQNVDLVTLCAADIRTGQMASIYKGMMDLFVCGSRDEVKIWKEAKAITNIMRKQKIKVADINPGVYAQVRKKLTL